MIVDLLSVPQSQEDWLRWSFANRVSHRVIRQGIVAKGGPQLVDYVLDPIDLRDFPGFLQRNNQSHIDESAFLGTELFDLQDVDYTNPDSLRGFCYIHWLIHQAEEAAAGMSS
jgi:hypothetical protein